jgi:hypothetical protein
MSQQSSDEPTMPHGFRTLRGAFTGDEPDEPPYFAYSATLRIFGDRLDLDDITHQLGLTPTNSHRKGDRRSLRSAPYQHDMWAYAAPVPEEQPLEAHIDALWADIKHAAAHLRALKHSATVDVFLGYRSNIDHAGVTVPATSLMMFIELEIPFGLSIIITE